MALLCSASYTAGTVRDGMVYGEGGDAFCRAGRGLQRLPAAIDAEKGLPGRDKQNHAVVARDGNSGLGMALWQRRLGRHRHKQGEKDVCVLKKNSSCFGDLFFPAQFPKNAIDGAPALLKQTHDFLERMIPTTLWCHTSFWFFLQSRQL